MPQKLQPLAKLTLCEFTPDDFEPAQKWCARLGYRDSYAYATSSSVPGLYCLPLRPTQKQTIIVRTAEFGLVAVQFLNED